MSRNMTKPIKWPVRPAKTRICLGICPVWSESLVCVQWVAKGLMFLHADSEDSDQTGLWSDWADASLMGVFAVRWMGS